MSHGREHRKWLAGLVVVALGAALLVAVPADRTDAHDSIPHASNSASVDPPQPAPQIGTPPPGHTRWLGKWSRWNHHSVPWRCDVNPELTWVTPPTYPPVSYSVDTRDYIGCAAANVNINGRDQTLGTASHSQWRYSGCTQFGPPGGAGCGHRLSATATTPVATGLDRFTAFFSTAISNEARAALIAQASARFRFVDNGRHQTWRYVFCGETLADDRQDGRFLVSGYRHHALERTAYWGKDPDVTYAGVPGATVLPPSSQRATGYHPEPTATGIDPSVPAQWAACWAADPLSVRAGPDVSVVDGSLSTSQIEASRGDVSTVAPCIEVDWVTRNGSAVAPADYTASSGTVTFPAGTLGVGVASATRPVAVATQPNSPGETDESFVVEITGQRLCPGETGTAPQLDARDHLRVTIQGTPAVASLWVPDRIDVVEGDPGDTTVATVTAEHDAMPGDVTSVGVLPAQAGVGPAQNRGPEAQRSAPRASGGRPRMVLA